MSAQDRWTVTDRYGRTWRAAVLGADRWWCDDRAVSGWMALDPLKQYAGPLVLVDGPMSPSIPSDTPAAPAAPDVADGVEEEPGVGAVVMAYRNDVDDHGLAGAYAGYDFSRAWTPHAVTLPDGAVEHFARVEVTPPTPTPQPDEGGTVEALARVLAEHDGVNWLDADDDHREMYRSDALAVLAAIRAGQVDGVRAVGAGGVVVDAWAIRQALREVERIVGDDDEVPGCIDHFRAALGDA